MTTISSLNPPHPTTSARITLAFTDPAANFCRIWCTDAPPGSKLKQQLTDGETPRIEVYTGTTGANDVWEFRADKPGTYVFKSQEYVRGASTYGGGYKGSPDSLPTETQLPLAGPFEHLFSVSFAQKLTWPLGVAPHTAELAVWVRGTSIRATTVPQQGEVTPAIVKPATPLARNAASQAGAGSVLEAVAALAGETATAALGDTAAIVTDIIDKFNAHRVQAGVHDANDTDNAIAGSFRNPAAPVALIATVGEVLAKLSRHMRNDNGAGTGSAAYHKPASGIVTSDWANTPRVTSAGDLAGACVALAEAWLRYEAHRTSSVHDASDTTNACLALPKLLELQKRWLSATASTETPVAAPTTNSGVILALAYGMTESA